MAEPRADTVPRRRRRLVRSRVGTVRARSALIAAAVVFVALVVGGFVATWTLRSGLTDNLDRTLLQQAQDRATLIAQGTEPTALTGTLQDEALVWIGTPDGTTVAVGAAVVPLDSPLPANLDGTADATLLVEERKPNEAPERERMSLRIASATTPDGSLVVVAGAETEIIDDTVGRVVTLFVIATPLLTALVAWLAWATVGRALRPVEAIRAETLNISGTSLSARVPVPAGRDEIHDLATTMNEMLARLEQHQHALRRFTSDASHELKSPVANVRALVDTADVGDPAWPPLRDRLVAETDRLRDLVENLLFLASSEDPGAVGMQRRRVEIDELVFGEAELLAATGRVRLDLSGVEPATTIGDERALGRLVRNLADNAARHARSTVWFSVRTSGGEVVVEVGDDGDGIDPGSREVVFDRFTRLDEARARDAGGAGLGLAIVRHIVNSHGGDVSIGEHRSGGALVSVRLPIDPTGAAG